MTSKETANIEGESRLDADLRRLRMALGELPTPAPDEASLRRAFRAQRRAVQSAGAAPRPRWRRVPALASAAALVVGVVAGALVGLDRFSSSGSDQAQAQQAEPPDFATAGAFQPLLYVPGFSPISGSYSVVRVRIPLSSLAIGLGGELEGTIEADVLLGEDGLARGIRFDAEDTLLVSTVSR